MDTWQVHLPLVRNIVQHVQLDLGKRCFPCDRSFQRLHLASPLGTGVIPTVPGPGDYDLPALRDTGPAPSFAPPKRPTLQDLQRQLAALLLAKRDAEAVAGEHGKAAAGAKTNAGEHAEAAVGAHVKLGSAGSKGNKKEAAGKLAVTSSKREAAEKLSAAGKREAAQTLAAADGGHPAAAGKLAPAGVEQTAGSQHAHAAIGDAGGRGGPGDVLRGRAGTAAGKRAALARMQAAGAGAGCPGRGVEAAGKLLAQSAVRRAAHSAKMQAASKAGS